MVVVAMGRKVVADTEVTVKVRWGYWSSRGATVVTGDTVAIVAPLRCCDSTVAETWWHCTDTMVYCGHRAFVPWQYYGSTVLEMWWYFGVYTVVIIWCHCGGFVVTVPLRKYYGHCGAGTTVGEL